MTPGLSGADVLDIGRDAIWLAVMMAGPVMLVGLVVGLVVALLQALTQIQEMTLVFVPKIIAIFIALLLFLPIMGAMLGTFTEGIFARIAEY
jgi:flagellar biosynthesis protein FliQ